MNDKSTAATEMKSVSGLKQGEVKFISAKKLSDANITGVVAEGTYEGIQEEQTKFGLKKNVKVRDSEGNLLVVNEAGNLNYRMFQAIEQGLQPGDAIAIAYLGKTPMTSGNYEGTLAHSFDVLIED